MHSRGAESIQHLCSAIQQSCEAPHLVHPGGLERASLAAHAACHRRARPHLARVLALPGGAAQPVRLARAVAGGPTRKAKALHDALEAVPKHECQLQAE